MSATALVMDLTSWRGPDLQFRLHTEGSRRWVTVETPWYPEALISKELLGDAPSVMQWEPETGTLTFTVENGKARYALKAIDPLHQCSYFEREG